MCGTLGPASPSRVVELALSGDQATVDWEHSADLACNLMGDVTRLDGGNTLVSWSSKWQLDEVTPQGEVLWRLSGPGDVSAGFVTPTEELHDRPW